MAAEKIVTESALAALASDAKRAIYDVLPGGSASGNPCTFDTDIAVPLKSLSAEIVASGGGGTPSTPIPIVGHSELYLVRCGLNLWDEEMEIGTLSWADGTPIENNSRMRFANFVPVKENTNYKIICPSDYDIIVYDISKNHLASYYNAGNVVFTVPTGGAYIKITTQASYGTTYNHDIGIMYPSNVSAYAPYNGTAYLVSFGQTVYGGEYDANAGKVRITWGTINLGSYDWTYVTNEAHPYFYTNLIGKKLGVNIGMLCDSFVYVAGYRAAVIENNYQIGNFNNSDITIVVRDDDYTDAATFKTAMNGKTLAYELATPIEIDVSELSVDTIVGVNNIVSDCGGDVEVEYRESVAKYVNDHSATRTDVVGTLTAGQTSITLSSAAITASSTIEVFTDPEVPYNSLTVTNGQAVLTFDAQANNVSVKVRVT